MLDVGMSRAYYGSLAAWRCQQLGGGWAAALPLSPPAAYLSPQAAVAPLQVVYVPEGSPLLAAEEALVGGSLEAPYCLAGKDHGSLTKGRCSGPTSKKSGVAR